MDAASPPPAPSAAATRQRKSPSASAPSAPPSTSAPPPPFPLSPYPPPPSASHARYPTHYPGAVPSPAAPYPPSAHAAAASPPPGVYAGVQPAYPSPSMPPPAPAGADAAHMHPAPGPSTQPARIYLATYSTVPVYEMTVRGIACMRRRGDGYLNATQILKVAGVEKTRRTKILDREILTGEHEKVQGGYGKYQGTWIPLRRAQQLAATYGVALLLKPLLELDPADDGSLTHAPKGRRINPNAPSQQRIVPAPPPAFAPPDSTPNGASSRDQQRMALRSPEGQAEPKRPRIDSAGSAGEPISNRRSFSTHLVPPSHKPRAEESVEAAALLAGLEPVRDLNMLGPDGDLLQAAALVPSENKALNVLRTGKSARMILGPPESLARDTSARFADRPQAFRTTGADEAQERALKEVLTSLFITTGPDNELTRNGTPLSQLQTLLGKMASALSRASGPGVPIPAMSVNIVLDDHGHAPIHWASALGELALVQMLVALPPEQGGANIQAGNYAGETALHRAVLVTNGYEADTFPALLGLLHESIFTRDYKRRTILHHIAMVAAIRGRAPSARYYLTAVLDVLFPHRSDRSRRRSDWGSIPPHAAQALLDAQDDDGETALGIVARIGNASMVRLLLDCGARRDLPNYLGIRPLDWGIDSLAPATQNEEAHMTKDVVASLARPPEPPLPKSEDVVHDINAALEEMETLHKAEMDSKKAAVAEAQAALQRATRDLAAQRRELAQAQQTDALIDEARHTMSHVDSVLAELRSLTPPVEEAATMEYIALDSQRLVAGQEWDEFVEPLLSAEPYVNHKEEELVRLRWLAYSLQQQASLWTARRAQITLRGQQREAKCRRVVAMCCNVDEDRVEEILDDLVLAVESDGPTIDLARLKGFMHIVKAGQGGQMSGSRATPPEA